jgi:hypothetical protein
MLEARKSRLNSGNGCCIPSSIFCLFVCYPTINIQIHNFASSLFECETSFLTLREKHRLRVLENTVLREIFGCQREEVTGDWRKVHNAELHGL